MMTESLNDFAAALRGHDAMAEGLVAAKAGKTEGEAREAFAAYARDCGYAVTRQDVEALMAAAQAGEGALSDDQLDTVSGGLLDLVTGPLFGAVSGAYDGAVKGAVAGAVDSVKLYFGR